LFGGGVKLGEQPRDAAKRELLEELGLDIDSLECVMRFEFDLAPLGLRKIARWFFLAIVSAADMQNIRLNEGVDVKAFASRDALAKLRLVYYDAFAIWALESRQRLLP
jgi:8-oxo-dGTP pyrophosphatase MutT (NUDIX family)